MARSKTATLTLRIDPDVKKGLRTAAERDHRSIANMVEVLVREHCEKVGIPIQTQAEEIDEPDEND